MVDELDPEIAALLEDTGEEAPADTGGGGGAAPPVNVSNYLKKVIENGNNYTNKMLEQLDKAMNAPLKEDKTLYRQRLIASYWNFAQGLVENISRKTAREKLMCLRYGIVDINLLNPHQRQLFQSLPWERSNRSLPIYYMDEWIMEISTGNIKASMVDEIKAKKSGNQDALQMKIAGKQDARMAEINILKGKAGERDLIEKSLVSEVNTLAQHYGLEEYDNTPDAYTRAQKDMMSKIVDDIRRLKNLDDDMQKSLRELRNIDSQIQDMEGRVTDSSSVVDNKVLVDEFNSVRQMIKMCIGPRGNHFPILISDYAPSEKNFVSTFENVLKELQEIEKRDAGVFVRRYKGQDNRIVPYFILVPAFGERGICWEPFDTRQRATSRGRIAIPLYPRFVRLALLCALGDLRWQVAKEYASYRWMEEGITGKYYNYFTENKLKGNIKDEFINDYIIWITQEWEGRQKLHKDVRMIFWRFVPFPQSKKEELKNRGFYYDDLYKRDVRRSMSDGY
ncbi:MAG: hypothetical protein JW827_05160 [Spirochaetes bacterium]|nr:hypothetical protein [Spirochaetota bacterium]